MTYKHVLIILMVSLFTACTTNTKDEADSATVEDRNAASGSDSSTGNSDSNSARSFGTGADGDTSMTALDDPQSPLSVRIIYFDYDSSEIQSQFRDTVEAHSAFLIANPEVIVALEGHADERGSREYNLALGERRSQTVRRQMTLLGVPSSQIRATSYGEERPVSEEHDDFAWSQNRRVEIIY
jgi:peptidoglycan-associated lipoprotein